MIVTEGDEKGMSVDVQISQSLYNKLDYKKISNALQKAVEQTVQRLDDECKDYSPVDTGHLRRSFSHDISSSDTAVKGRVKNSTNYWIYQEFGTRYIPAQGFIQRAVEVTEPGKLVIEEFQSRYKPNG